MTTREKILDTARELFNTQGLANVSVRTICKAMNISLGNFSYHFPDRGKLVVELYGQLEQELMGTVSRMTSRWDTFNGYLEAHRLVFSIQLRYKFFYLNLFAIVTDHPELRSRYLATVENGKKTARQMLKKYQEHGVVKSGIPLDYVERMIDAAYLLDRYWLMDTEIGFDGTEKEKLTYYLGLCCSLIEPFLTARSKAEYQRFTL